MKTRKQMLALLAATTCVVAGCSSGGDYGDPDEPMANQAPAISNVISKTEFQDTVIGPLAFEVQDDQTPAAQLTVTAAADLETLFPADGLVLAGDGATRNLTLTPLEAATGSANVTLTVTDAQGAASTRTFTVTVNAREASIREWALTTFAKGESDDATAMNGFTFTQDADDPAIFEPLIGVE
jgi:hypothetical protein